MRTCKVEGCNRKHFAKEYCNLHYYRKVMNVPLNRVFGNKAENNPNWKGGVAEYPNHYLMKQRRLVLLKKYPICCICHKKPSTQVHHKDGSKNNHSWNNLIPSCIGCNCKIRFAPNNTKNYRKYGMSFYEIAKKIDCSYNWIWRQEKLGLLESILI